MNMESQCRACLMRQIEELTLALNLEPGQRKSLMAETAEAIAAAPLDRPAPLLAREIHARIKTITGIDDPYASIKKKGNAAALAALPRARRIIEESADPFGAALKIAVAGNIIDCGAPGGATDSRSVIAAIEAVMSAPLSGEPAASLEKDIATAGGILYVGDNSGEIVFDRAFIERLQPGRVAFATRGAPVLNDATPADAAATGMDLVARCVDTGDATPGIDLARSSRAFLDELARADLVILKGQGNLETMYNADLRGFTKQNIPLYFLFKVKCDHVAACTGLESGAAALLKRRSWLD
jgi:uncharacterized protein with ATP-grasp and redox domains